MVELYAEDAVFLPDPATVVTGIAAVEEGLRGLVAVRPTLTFSEDRTFTSGNVALVTHSWHLQGTLPDGAPVEQRGRTINVLRREDDGQWRLAIDNPWDGVTSPTVE